MNNKLSVVTWLWEKKNKKNLNKPNKFNEENVEDLYNCFKKNYDLPFDFFCIADKKYNFSKNIKKIEMPDIFCDQQIYEKGCYRRIALFNPEYGLKLGERILQLDIDINIVNNVTELFNIKDNLKIWQAPSTGPIKIVKNPTVMIFNVKDLEWFYKKFKKDYKKMIEQSNIKYAGTDQALFSEFFKCDVWTEKDGIYSFRDYEEVNKDILPKNAKIISFNSAKSWREKKNLNLKWMD